MEITDALARFETQLAADGRSVHTRKQVRRHVLALAHWAASERLSADIEDLDHEHLAQFLASPAANARPDGTKKRATSVNALRSSLRVFCRFCHDAGYTPTNPARLIKRAITSPPPPRALTTREEERFLAVLSKAKGAEEERDAVLFRLLLRTGLRLSSAIGLDIADTDLDEGVLAVRTKGDRSERVYIAQTVRDELQKFIGNRTGAIFADRFGRRISARHTQRRFRQWREKAGISRAITLHGLRHTYATALYRRTGDIALVQRALGHRSITSTLVYAEVDEQRLRSIVDA